MKQIYYSDNLNISYDDKSVNLDGKNVTSDKIGELTSGEGSPENFAFNKMREDYSAELSRQYEEIIVLSGAGTSVGIGVGEKLGKTMAGLWCTVVEKVGYNKLVEFCEQIKYSDIKKEYTNLEELLSKAKMSHSFLSNKTVQTMIDDIEKIIRNECSLVLPENAPHLRFLRKLTARKLKYSRVKIFTLNYDLLFEQAAMKGGYVLVDGFSFSHPRIFNGINFDYDIVIRNNNRAISEENFATNVFHLYKPHGSLDWDKDKESGIIKKTENPSNPLMIYPNSSKFEYSFEQPFYVVK